MKHLLTALLLGLTAATAQARDVLPFNDGWIFKKMPATTDARQAAAQWNGRWDSVSLPHTWNAHDMQQRANNFYAGPAYYRKTCVFPAEWKGNRLFLRFEGVGACADVYVNGRLVGSHRGAYSAFACEIQNDVKFGQANEILVRADNSARPDVIPVNHNLFGVYGGIYRPVWLVVTDPCHIAVTDYASPGVYVRQQNVSARSADVSVRVKLDNATLHPQPVTLETTVSDAEGKVVASDRRSFDLTAQGQQTLESRFTLTLCRTGLLGSAVQLFLPAGQFEGKALLDIAKAGQLGGAAGEIISVFRLLLLHVGKGALLPGIPRAAAQQAPAQEQPCQQGAKHLPFHGTNLSPGPRSRRPCVRYRWFYYSRPGGKTQGARKSPGPPPLIRVCCKIEF